MTTAKDYVSQCGSGTLERPRYSAGLLLEDDDLTAAVDYTRNMMRLMFRSLFGCGVICGLDVNAKLTCNNSKIEVTVGKGVALDCVGNPIEIPKDVPITYDPDCTPFPEEFDLWVVVCYCEKCCRPRDISCRSDDTGHLVKTRILDGFEVRLYDTRPKCVCSCEPPDEDHPAVNACCDDDETPATPAPSDATGATGEGSAPAGPAVPPECQCYVAHAKGKCGCDCCCPCVLVGKVHVTFDPVSVDSNPHPEFVRRIRPMLMAYYNCLNPQAVPLVPLLARRPRPRRRRRTAAAQHGG
jgi:hypothetical protein